MPVGNARSPGEKFRCGGGDARAFGGYIDGQHVGSIAHGHRYSARAVGGSVVQQYREHLAHGRGLLLHMDGARLMNAVVASPLAKAGCRRQEIRKA